MTHSNLPPLPPADGTVNFGYGDQPAWARWRLQEYARAAVLADRERRKAYEAMRDAEPCQGCRAAAAGLLWDVEGACSKCGWQGDTSNLHSCKTGWRKPVCERCNHSGEQVTR